MRTHLALAAGLALGAAIVPPASAAIEHPRETCPYRVDDSAGDAQLNYSPVAGTPARPLGSIDSLDITNVTLRLTDTELQAFVHVNALGALGLAETGRRYVVTFKQGAKSYVFENAVFNPTVPDTLRPAGPFPAAKGATAFSGAGGGIDAATNDVWITAPRAGVEADLGRALVEGDVFDSIEAHTLSYDGTQSWPADDASGTGMTYVVGDDLCFGPPPAVLDDLDVPPVQYGDASAASVVLLDDAWTELAGRPVEWYVNGVAAGTATSDADGVVAMALPAMLPAGTYPVVVRFAGDDSTGKRKAMGTLVVSREVTKLAALKVAKPTRTTRTVTATLLDDDGHAVAGQRVDWYVNGRKVGTATTDSKGRAVLKTAKPGQRVQARYPGVSGKYAAASSATVTA